jgi:hypothetical protein
MTRRASLKASDADREHIAEQLRLAAAEGRLFADELEERLGAALTARTYGELDALVADLPPSSAVAQSARQSLGRGPVAVLAVAIPLGLLLIGLVVSAFSGHGHPYHHGGGAPLVWLVWLAIGWRLLMRRRRAR